MVGEPERIRKRMAQIIQVMGGRGEKGGKNRAYSFLPDIYH